MPTCGHAWRWRRLRSAPLPALPPSAAAPAQRLPAGRDGILLSCADSCARSLPSLHSVRRREWSTSPWEAAAPACAFAGVLAVPCPLPPPVAAAARLLFAAPLPFVAPLSFVVPLPVALLAFVARLPVALGPGADARPPPPALAAAPRAPPPRAHAGAP